MMRFALATALVVSAAARPVARDAPSPATAPVPISTASVATVETEAAAQWAAAGNNATRSGGNRSASAVRHSRATQEDRGRCEVHTSSCDSEPLWRVQCGAGFKDITSNSYQMSSYAWRPVDVDKQPDATVPVKGGTARKWGCGAGCHGGSYTDGNCNCACQPLTCPTYVRNTDACPAAPPLYQRWQQGCVNENNIIGHAGKTVAECAALCDADSSCLAFEYGVDYGGGGGYKAQDCYLQSSANSAGCDGGYWDTDLYVKAVKARPADAFKVIFVSDLELGYRGHREQDVEDVMDEIIRQRPALVIHGGDSYDDSESPSQYLMGLIPKVYTKLIDAGIGFITTNGNHDAGQCPADYPFPTKAGAPLAGNICYRDAASANAGSGPCGSWCTTNVNVGSGCGDNSGRVCENIHTRGLQVSAGASYCQVDANNCVSDGTGNHGDNEACTINVLGAGTLTATDFNTESGYDYVTIGGTRYSGGTGPSNVAVAAGSTFTWRSDSSITSAGFTICWAPDAPRHQFVEDSYAATLALARRTAGMDFSYDFVPGAIGHTATFNGLQIASFQWVNKDEVDQTRVDAMEAALDTDKPTFVVNHEPAGNWNVPATSPPLDNLVMALPERSALFSGHTHISATRSIDVYGTRLEHTAPYPHAWGEIIFGAAKKQRERGMLLVDVSPTEGVLSVTPIDTKLLSRIWPDGTACGGVGDLTMCHRCKNGYKPDDRGSSLNWVTRSIFGANTIFVCGGY